MSTPMRPELPPLPASLQHLPIDERGYPVPWFVQYIGGKPDHRIMDARKIVLAIKDRLCWVCGKRLEIDYTFVIGPMCTINRISAEPPSHYECGLYSVKACPFLTKPHAKRREAGMPDGSYDAPGLMLKHNPQVMALYTCQSFALLRVDHGILFQLNPPTQRVDWFTAGRLATRKECEDGIQVGYPELVKQAELDGEKGIKELARLYQASLRLLPES